MLRQFKQDMAILPDIQGMDEYEEVPVQGFGAALLAGYGWKEGHTIGKNKTKGDAKVVERVRRFGTHGIGFKPSKKTTTQSRLRSFPAGKENMTAKKERENAMEESDS
jgi:G patch domain/KOW motif-containing protein